MKESIRTNIRNAIEYGLRQINTTNSYNVTINRIYSVSHTIENSIEYPFVNIQFGNETYNPNGFTNGYLVKLLPVTFELYVKDVNNLEKAEMKILADIEDYFMNNDCLPDENKNNQLVGDLMFTENKVMGIEEDKPYGKVIMKMNILYHQKLTDPKSTEFDISTLNLKGNLARTIRVSKREEAQEAILNTLKKIKKSGGYNYDIGNRNISQLFKTPPNINQYPFINIGNGVEKVSNADNNYLQDRRLYKEVDYNVGCFLKNTNDVLLSQERLLADIEKVIIANYNLYDKNKKRTVISCFPVSNKFYACDTNNPFGYFSIKLRCTYKQYIYDPAEITSN